MKNCTFWELLKWRMNYTARQEIEWHSSQTSGYESKDGNTAFRKIWEDVKRTKQYVSSKDLTKPAFRKI